MIAVRFSLFFLILLAVVLAVVVFGFSATPAIDLPSSLSALGTSTPVTIHISDAHGIRRASVWVEQNGNRYPVCQTSEPARWLPWGHEASDRKWTFEAGTHL